MKATRKFAPVVLIEFEIGDVPKPVEIPVAWAMSAGGTTAGVMTYVAVRTAESL
jgi:hypothetical protein